MYRTEWRQSLCESHAAGPELEALLQSHDHEVSAALGLCGMLVCGPRRSCSQMETIEKALGKHRDVVDQLTALHLDDPGPSVSTLAGCEAKLLRFF